MTLRSHVAFDPLNCTDKNNEGLINYSGSTGTNELMSTGSVGSARRYGGMRTQLSTGVTYSRGMMMVVVF